MYQITTSQKPTRAGNGYVNVGPKRVSPKKWNFEPHFPELISTKNSLPHPFSTDPSARI